MNSHFFVFYVYFLLLELIKLTYNYINIHYNYDIVQYTMRHAHCDIHFDNIKNNPTSIFDEKIERNSGT